MHDIYLRRGRKGVITTVNSVTTINDIEKMNSTGNCIQHHIHIVSSIFINRHLT